MSLNQLLNPIGPVGQEGLLNIKVNNIEISGTISVGENVEFGGDVTGTAPIIPFPIALI